MQYIRAIVRLDTGERVYRQDLSIADVFASCVELVTARMVNESYIREGEPLKIWVTSGHGSAPESWPPVLREQQDTTDWEAVPYLSFVPDPSLRLNEPIPFFWLELGVVATRRRYGLPITIAGLYHVSWLINEALWQYGCLDEAQGTTLEFVLCDCDEGEGDLDREEILHEIDNRSLIVNVPVGKLPPIHEVRRVANYQGAGLELTPLHGTDVVNATSTYRDARSDASIIIIIHSPVLKAMREIACRPPRIEQGGLLLGRIYHNGDRTAGGFIIEVTDIQVHTTLPSLRERFSFDSWEYMIEDGKQREPDYRAVGWYRTHLSRMPDYWNDETVPRAPSGSSATSDDRYLHGKFFRGTWYDIIMVDPADGSTIFVCGSGLAPFRREWYIIASHGQQRRSSW